MRLTWIVSIQGKADGFYYRGFYVSRESQRLGMKFFFSFREKEERFSGRVLMWGFLNISGAL